MEMLELLEEMFTNKSKRLSFRNLSSLKLNTKMETQYLEAAKELMAFGDRDISIDDFPFEIFFKMELLQICTMLNHYLKLFCSCSCAKVVAMDHQFMAVWSSNGDQEDPPLKYLKEVRSLLIDVKEKAEEYSKPVDKIVKRIGNIVSHILSEHGDIDHRALENTYRVGLKILAFKKVRGGRYYNSIASTTLAVSMCYYNAQRVMMNLEPIRNDFGSQDHDRTQDEDLE